MEQISKIEQEFLKLVGPERLAEFDKFISECEPPVK